MNNNERKLGALFCSVMALQIIDDYQDREGDRQLGVHSVALQMERITPEVETRCNQIAQNYFSKAQQAGMSRGAVVGLEKVFRTMKALARIKPHKAGGRREKLLATNATLLQQSQ